MPRRLRLTFAGNGQVTGVIQRPYGTNYAGWDHPLTPYYRQTTAGERLPVHPKPGIFGYRHWLGIVAALPDKPLRERAACISTWERRTTQDEDIRVIVAGWAMDNMKPLDFIASEQPLIALEPGAANRMAGIIEAAEKFAAALRGALEPVLKDGEAREAWRETFFVRTQAPFERHVRSLKSGADPAEVSEDWRKATRAAAMAIFDTVAMSALDLRKADEIAKIVAARGILEATFRGFTKLGKEAFTAMNLEVQSRSKEPAP
jgi:CRISPR system Cascade subunit CasA